MGGIGIELFPNHTPKTVANFIDLTTGTKEWLDPNIGRQAKTNLYSDYFSKDNFKFYNLRPVVQAL